MNPNSSPPASFPENENMDPVGEPYPNQEPLAPDIGNEPDQPIIPKKDPPVPQDPESDRTVPPEPLGA